jgi:26S proteasome regulatory subunit T2
MGNTAAPPKKPSDNTSINLKRKKRVKDSKSCSKLPIVAPTNKCKLRCLKLQKIRQFLALEENLLGLVETNPTDKDNSKATMVSIRGNPGAIGTLEEFIDDDHAIVSTGMGLEYYSAIMSFVDKDLLEPGCTVLLNNKDHTVVGVMESDVDPLVSVMKLERAPTETYADIGGLESQIQEIKESVELPLTNPELFQEMGIKPPKGVILYGLPGTGKTLLAKAVANSTSATFLRIVGSELIQKYLGDGPKLVREMFKVAESHAPAIIFIDEIDAIGHRRYDTDSSGEKEVQRTMLELLNQLDGFDTRDDIKVIMATNKIESLDSALIRPGRIDRKIYFGMPDVATKRRIFTIHTSKMTFDKSVILEDLISSKEDLSGADIKAICTEAGMSALRDRRKFVSMDDFVNAREKILYSKQNAIPTGFYS